MKKMVIFTTLFFNKVGNQSMLETVRQYSKHADIFIITSSSSSDSYYLTSDEAKKALPNNVTFYRQSGWFKNIFRFAFGFIKKLKGRKKEHKVKVNDNSLVNLKYTRLNIISFHVTYFTLFIDACLLRLFKKLPSADFICGYEIGGVVPAQKYKKLFNSKAVLFSKMQGTILFDAIKNNKEFTDTNYSLDHEAYLQLKNFDLVCMTNDGTYGDKVLEHYGVPPSCYLHIMNGISKGIIHFSEDFNYIQEMRTEIKLVAISRLVGWKRVYLGIEVLNKLINLHNKKEFRFDIYGHGSNDEVDFLNNLIDKYALQKYITVHGQVEHSRVPSLMVDADFILSLYKMTNVTNPLLEAMFLNVPVITLSDSSLLSIVENDERKNRFIFDELSEESLVDEVSNFLNQCDIEKIRSKRCDFNGETPSELMTWEKRISTEIKTLTSML